MVLIIAQKSYINNFHYRTNFQLNLLLMTQVKNSGKPVSHIVIIARKGMSGSRLRVLIGSTAKTWLVQRV